jgi:biopolymer transport protein ExbD
MDTPKIQAITVDSAGNLKLNASPVASIADLESKLAAVKSTLPDAPVVVRGDSGTQYQLIMDVLDVLGRTGFEQIGLATKPNK